MRQRAAGRLCAVNSLAALLARHRAGGAGRAFHANAVQT